MEDRPQKRFHGIRRFESLVVTLAYDLTIFKMHSRRLTGKIYTNGKRVLQTEAIAHNTMGIRYGRVLGKFFDIIENLVDLLQRFLRTGR